MWLSCDEHFGAASSSPWHVAGFERPVFLDERGRRHRLLRPFAVLVVVLTAGWLAGIVAGATGFAGLAPLRPPVAARRFVAPVPAVARHPARNVGEAIPADAS